MKALADAYNGTVVVPRPPVPRPDGEHRPKAPAVLSREWLADLCSYEGAPLGEFRLRSATAVPNLRITLDGGCPVIRIDGAWLKSVVTGEAFDLVRLVLRKDRVEVDYSDAVLPAPSDVLTMIVPLR
ncbi:MAG: hypothetical protein WBC44_09460 [Planctomycetaceae bacterium]